MHICWFVIYWRFCEKNSFLHLCKYVHWYLHQPWRPSWAETLFSEFTRHIYGRSNSTPHELCTISGVLKSSEILLLCNFKYSVQFSSSFKNVCDCCAILFDYHFAIISAVVSLLFSFIKVSINYMSIYLTAF